MWYGHVKVACMSIPGKCRGPLTSHESSSVCLHPFPQARAKLPGKSPMEDSSPRQDMLMRPFPPSLLLSFLLSFSAPSASHSPSSLFFLSSLSFLPNSCFCFPPDPVQGRVLFVRSLTCCIHNLPLQQPRIGGWSHRKFQTGMISEGRSLLGNMSPQNHLHSIAETPSHHPRNPRTLEPGWEPSQSSVATGQDGNYPL